jgi:DNA topoisomerase-1
LEKHTFVITEKPDAARRIALALDSEEKPQRLTENRMPYYVARREREIVVVPALGHLYTVAPEKNERSQYPTFNYRWVPRHLAGKNAHQIRAWLEAISKLAQNADEFIDACDYDIEGSIIGYNILKHACGGKEREAKRMKYSTLTKEELEKSYNTLLPHLDFALIEAGLARHEVDWLYGINLSRALTTAAKNYSGKYATLSTGRVQGPALKFIAERERRIKSFVPTPYWRIRAHVEIDGQPFEAQYEKEKIEIRREAQEVQNACTGKNGQVNEVEAKQFQQLPPVPFDLGLLQSEAYRLFGYMPKRTAIIAQRLYLDALISYPRTSSQKLPPTINYKAILKDLSAIPEYRKLVQELLAQPTLKPIQGSKDDPAHPAIYPTGKLPPRELDRYEKNILDLIVRRFMAAFAESATRQSIKITIKIGDKNFYLRGMRVLKMGWPHYYGPYARDQEVILPPLTEGQAVTVRSVEVDEKFTNPLPKHNPSSLLKKMETANIGTKATRADIIQTLYDRKYIQNEKINVTDLGYEILEVLEKYCSTIVSVAFTKELEQRMSDIQTHSGKREELLASTIETLRPVLEQLKQNEQVIGEILTEALRKTRTEERTIGTCLDCRTGKLVILYSKKTGKRFVGCTSFFKGQCKTSFPLPQKGTVKPLAKTCSRCGWPMIQLRIRGRRPWTMCLNLKCPSKEERDKCVDVQNMR